MRELEYRVPSPFFLRLTLEDRASCLTRFNDPILTSTKLSVKPSPSDEMVIEELNSAKKAMEFQTREITEQRMGVGLLLNEETSTSEEEEEEEDKKEVLTASPVLGGAHGLVVSKWLQRHFEVQSQTSLSRGELFKAYIIHCERNNITHCNPATFGKILRSVFPGVKTRRIGTRGNSRYHYQGIGVKPKACRQEKEQKSREIINNKDVTLLIEGPNILVENSQELLPLLHGFPTCEDLGLLKSENQVVEDFLNLTYWWHAVRLLDCVLRAEFYQVKDIIGDFWRSVPLSTLTLLSVPLVVAAIERCDQIIYRTMNGLLLPRLLSPLPKGLMLTLNHFVKNLLYWHQEGLTSVPPVIKNAKVKAVRQFKSSFLRQIQINHMSITAHGLVEGRDTAGTVQRAWHQLQRYLRKNPVLDHFTSDSSGTNLICQYLREYGNLWDTSCSLHQHLNWVEGIVLNNMAKVTRLSQSKSASREQLIRQFVLEWTYISTQILKLVTFISPAALGPLHLLDIIYKDYVLFLLERWDVY
ncbi:regulatory factor X 4-like [Crassostrea virginica]